MPIAVGAGDLWPAGALVVPIRARRVLDRDAADGHPGPRLHDPCWVEAGELLQDFVASNPFQDGFLATSGQQGADSSAGLVANGKPPPWSSWVTGTPVSWVDPR